MNPISIGRKSVPSAIQETFFQIHIVYIYININKYINKYIHIYVCIYIYIYGIHKVLTPYASYL